MRSAGAVTSYASAGGLTRLRQREDGAGSVVALMVITSCMALMSLLIPFISFGVVHARAQSLSDQAALVAANALNGAAVGIPCDEAAAVVAQIHTQSWSCTLDRGDAFVVIDVAFGPVVFSVRSRAGIRDMNSASSMTDSRN